MVNFVHKLKKIPWHLIGKLERNFSNHDQIFVAGWIGSGSTFIYQALKSLGYDVIKVHGFPKNNDGALTLYSIRDPRDVVLSTARRQFGNVWNDGKKEEALLSAIDHVHKLNFEADLNICLNSRHRLIVRYEYFFGGNEQLLIQLLAEQIDVKSSPADVEHAVAENSIEANQRRIGRLKDFSQFDKKSLLHGNHISGGGKQGGWRDEFSSDTLKYFEKRLGGLMKASGYMDV